MSDEPKPGTKTDESDKPASDEPASSEAARDEAASTEAANDEAASGEKLVERFDEDGLPLDRDATIDDVRSKTGLHGRIGLGCALLIVLFVVAFWLIRAGALD